MRKTFPNKLILSLALHTPQTGLRYLTIRAQTNINERNLMITGAKKMRGRLNESDSKAGPLKTFTYFIPAPPARKSGYREKEFDKIIDGILKSGFELMELQSQSMSSGVLVIAILRAKNKKAAKLDLHYDIQDKFKLQDSYSSPEIVLED